MCLYSVGVLAAWLGRFLGFFVSVLFWCWPCFPSPGSPPLGPPLAVAVGAPWVGLLARPLSGALPSPVSPGLGFPCGALVVPFPPWAVCGSVPGIMLLHVLGDETFCACRPMWLKPRSAPVNGSGARLRSPPSFPCLLSQFISLCYFSHGRNHGSRIYRNPGLICRRSPEPI